MVQERIQFQIQPRRWLRSPVSLTAIFALLAIFCFWQGFKQDVSVDVPVVETTPVSATRSAHVPYTTKTIRDVRVGDRVLSHNPLISDVVRSTWDEPVAEGLRQLSLEMDLVGGDVLTIEMLRPVAWLEVVDAQIGGSIDLDLPEMGAVGLARVVNIQHCPPLKTGSTQGRIVTATFSHPPSSQVLDVWFEDASEPIGVTDNHRFWSVERQDFASIGQMAIGEHVQTYHGDTKRIEQKLPRPGPQRVYNLEVYGEHVYFVSSQGVLVHNAYARDTTPIILRAVDETHTLSMRSSTWRELAKSISGDEKAVVYVVRTSNGDILKVGKATTDMATSLIGRFRHYEKGGKLTGLDVYVDVFKFDKSKDYTIQVIEKEIHTNLVGQHLALRWSNEGQRLGRVGPGEPGKYSSSWFKKGYRWLGVEGFDNWIFGITPTD